MKIENSYPILLIFSLLSYSNLFCQKEDHIWIIGSDAYDIIIPERAADTTRGSSNLDFNFDPPKSYYVSNRFLDMQDCNASICDKEGQLLAYTNGMVIYNYENESIADTINYNLNWENNKVVRNGIVIPLGLGNVQSALLLPHPSKNSQYFAIYTSMDMSNIFFNTYQMSYALVEFNSEFPSGQVLYKDKIILEDSLGSQINAIKHGNGRDWWVISPAREPGKVYVCLLGTEGFKTCHLRDTGISSGLPEGGKGQIYSSPCGNWIGWYAGWYLVADQGRAFLARFDRCTGELSDADMIPIDNSFIYGEGASFSNKYFYSANGNYIYQYDLSKAKPLQHGKRVAEYDGYKYFFPWDTMQVAGKRTNFTYLASGPDGRIYICPTPASQRMMGVMHYPDEEGIACDVRQHSLLMPTMFARGIPNFPHYRMGPLDGSPCDTLGMDNHPVSKFRYEADSLDHRDIRFTDLSYFRPETWTWDFGDGSASIITQHPYHTYERNGIYNVCLTVSNENSSNTSCRTLNIGIPVSTEDTARPEIQLSLFPNPTSDFATITLGEYIPQKGQVVVYDIAGRQVLSQCLYHGHNTLNLSSCAPGLYIWKALDGMVEIGSGKVVRE